MADLGFTYTSIYADSTCTAGKLFMIEFTTATAECIPISTCYSVSTTGGTFVTTGCTTAANIPTIIASSFQNQSYFTTTIYNSANCTGPVSASNAFSIENCAQATTDTSSKVSLLSGTSKTYVISSFNNTDCSGTKLASSPDTPMIRDMSFGYTITTVYASSSCVAGNIASIQFTPAIVVCTPLPTCSSVTAVGGAYVSIGCSIGDDIPSVLASTFLTKQYVSITEYHNQDCTGTVAGYSAYSVESCGQSDSVSTQVSLLENKEVVITTFNTTDCSGFPLNLINLKLNGACQKMSLGNGARTSYIGKVGGIN
ncbi:UNVERIFIED_CONTAM: hypothetical protein HDU68_002755 [Siphonaria sp. JEL0065]|nr:hypothetical protein HDU68_002755 [Siphonaria sp. JEL0065]